MRTLRIRFDCNKPTGEYRWRKRCALHRLLVIHHFCCHLVLCSLECGYNCFVQLVCLNQLFCIKKQALVIIQIHLLQSISLDWRKPAFSSKGQPNKTWLWRGMIFHQKLNRKQKAAPWVSWPLIENTLSSLSRTSPIHNSVFQRKPTRKQRAACGQLSQDAPERPHVNLTTVRQA
jgi:hypothetical protein